MRHAALLICLGLMLTVVGCGTPLLIEDEDSGAQSSTMPRWTCPTPTPRPYGEAGPVKEERDRGPDPTTGLPRDPEREYYDIWEQEYGDQGGPPFPAPTVQSKSNTATFYLGQIVNLGAWDLQVEVEPTAHRGAGGTRVYLVRVRWTGGDQPLRFDPERQIALAAVRLPTNRQAFGPWWTTQPAAELAGRALPAALTIPPGQETVIAAPILGPDGTVETVDVRLDLTGAGDSDLRVQFARGEDPFCGFPGTRGAVYQDIAREVVGPAAPAGTNQIVASAYAMLGRQYCWGGKGYSSCDGRAGGAKQVTPGCASYPCFDCSGLTWWAYNENGAPIGQGTSNQKNYPAVWAVGSDAAPQTRAQPGDLLLFSAINANGRGARITHVGLYAGDLDGDGTGDMIHSANYPTGVVFEHNVFGSHYYMSHLVVITRPPQGGE